MPHKKLVKFDSNVFPERAGVDNSVTFEPTISPQNLNEELATPSGDVFEPQADLGDYENMGAHELDMVSPVISDKNDYVRFRRSDRLVSDIEEKRQKNYFSVEKQVLFHDEVALKDRMSDPEDDMEAFNSPLGRIVETGRR